MQFKESLASEGEDVHLDTMMNLGGERKYGNPQITNKMSTTIYTILLSILASSIQCQTQFVDRIGSVVHNSESFKTDKLMVKFKGEHTGYAVAEGNGEISLTFQSPITGKNMTVKCLSYRQKLCPLWNNDNDTLVGGEEIDIQINYTVIGYNRLGSLSFTVTFFSGKAVEWAFGTQQQLTLKEVPNLDLLLVLRDTGVDIPENPKDKLQIVASHNQWNWMNYDESVMLKVRKGDKTISPKDTIKHYSATLGLGVIASIVKGDLDFCDKACVVAVRIESEKTADISIGASISLKEPEINVANSVQLVDHLRANTTIRYLISSTFANLMYYSFALIPIEGNPDMYVNEDANCPEDISNYRWKTEQNTTEVISFNQNQLKKFNISGGKFYLAIKTEKETSFAIQVDNYNSYMPAILMLNTPITGQTFEGEVMNYRLALTAHQPESYDMVVYLSAITGNPDLYMKECSNYQQPCEITKQDIEQRDTLKANPITFFRYSNQLETDDSTDLKFNCIPPGMVRVFNEEEKKKYFDNGLFTSFTCMFVIGIHGKKTETETLSKFRLMVKGQNHHEPMGIGYNMNFRCYANQDIVFTGFFSLPSNVKSLVFTFNIVSGDADFFVSRTNPSPDKDNFDKSLIIDNESTDLYAKSKRIVFSSENYKDLEGRYYLRIRVGCNSFLGERASIWVV